MQRHKPCFLYALLPFNIIGECALLAVVLLAVVGTILSNVCINLR